MLNILKISASIATLIALPALSTAQDGNWYVRGNTGYGINSDADLTGAISGDIEGEGNLVGTAGIGYEFDNKWRVELDGTSLWNDMGAISQLPNTKSSLRTNALMLNAIYDFSDFGRWEPYVGAGLGFVKGKLSASAHDFPSSSGAGAVQVTNASCSPICDISETAGSMGWNVQTGLGYKVNENLTWDTQYKYLNAGDMDFNGTRQLTAGGPTSATSSTLEDIGAHMVTTGFRYRFGGKAAPKRTITTPVITPMPLADYRCWDGSMVFTSNECPAQPAPVQQATFQCWDGSSVFDEANCPAIPAPPVVVETPTAVTTASICDQGSVPFVVYFEWDKSRLTDQASAVIDQAGEYTRQCGVEAVLIEGHTDSSGAPSYNEALSSKRADTVAGALVSRGVDAQRISKQARGETALAVSTGDNVREPLNRRSEVLITLTPQF